MRTPVLGHRTLIPRIIRLRDAHFYVGMDRNRFNREVRPYLTQIPIGAQGVGFDLLELDQWVDDYIARNGRPAEKGATTWDANQYQVSSSGKGSGISTKSSAGGAFAKALGQIGKTKPKS